MRGRKSTETFLTKAKNDRSTVKIISRNSFSFTLFRWLTFELTIELNYLIFSVPLIVMI